MVLLFPWFNWVLSPALFVPPLPSWAHSARSVANAPSVPSWNTLAAWLQLASGLVLASGKELLGQGGRGRGGISRLSTCPLKVKSSQKTLVPTQWIFPKEQVQPKVCSLSDYAGLGCQGSFCHSSLGEERARGAVSRSSELLQWAEVGFGAGMPEGLLKHELCQ